MLLELTLKQPLVLFYTVNDVSLDAVDAHWIYEWGWLGNPEIIGQ